jgi:HEAT repeat protein
LIGLVAVAAIGLGIRREVVVESTRRQIWTLQHDTDAGRRLQAAEAISANPSGLTSEESFQIFNRALDDPSPRVRFTAVLALFNLSRNASLLSPALARASRDPDRSVRLVAIALMGPFASEGRDREVVIPALIGALKDTSAGNRCRAAVYLARVGRGREVVVPMIEILEGKCEDSTREQGITIHRLAAIQVLETVGPAAKDAIPVLRVATRDHRGRIRVAAARALASIGEAEDVLKTLRDALEDPDPIARQDATRALERLDPDFLNP